MSAGWYPDPQDPGLLRWWDGAAWTTATNAADPTRLAHAAPGAAPAGWYEDPYGVEGLLRWWTGSEWSGHTHKGGPRPEALTDRVSQWLAQAAHSPSVQECVQTFRLRGLSTPFDGGDRTGLRAGLRAVAPVFFTVFLTLWASGLLLFVLLAAGARAAAVAALVALTAAAAVALVALVRSARRWSRLTDLPTSTPLSSGAGLVEARGTLSPVSGLTQTWMSGRDAVFWHAKFEAEVTSGKNPYWEELTSMGSPGAWLTLTGPDGGELLMPAAGWTQLLHDAAPAMVEVAGRARCTESVLQPGEPLTVVGEVVVTPECRLELRPTDGSSVSMADPAVYERRLLWTVRAVGSALAAAVVADLAVASALSPALAATAAAGVATGAFGAWLWWSQARLAAVGERIAGSFAVIEAFAQRRHDVVPALAAAAAAAADHEQAVQLAAARTAAPRMPSAAEADATDRMLQADTPAAAGLRAQAEAQPELRARAAFDELFHELVRCEDQLAGARTTYNEAVRIAADRRGTFPTSLVARRTIPELPPYLSWQ